MEWFDESQKAKTISIVTGSPLIKQAGETRYPEPLNLIPVVGSNGESGVSNLEESQRTRCILEVAREVFAKTLQRNW
jgi:hypothetical protein